MKVPLLRKYDFVRIKDSQSKSSKISTFYVMDDEEERKGVLVWVSVVVPQSGIGSGVSPTPISSGSKDICLHQHLKIFTESVIYSEEST